MTSKEDDVDEDELLKIVLDETSTQENLSNDETIKKSIKNIFPSSVIEAINLGERRSKSKVLSDNSMFASHSPTLRRELAKSIVNTFCLSPKPEFNVACYKLYHETISAKAKEMHRLAKEAFEAELYESCLSYLHKALIMEPNNIDYFILRADTYLQLCDFKSAILNYKRVCILEPENDQYFTKLAFIYFLQGECYFDEGLYFDALECFTRAAEMKPENSGYHARSIACLASLKRHKECLALINKRLEVQADNSDLLILRARLHLIFNNSTLSYLDVKEAMNLDPNNPEAGSMQESLESNAEMFKEKAVKLDMSGKTKEALMKISHAIDINPSVIEYHILRAGMHRRNGDFSASVDDLLLAMSKSFQPDDNDLYKQAQKQLLLTFNDFAVDCFHKGFYEESLVLLEKAIKGEKEDKALYTNRGDCFYKLGHLHFALLDYQQAEEIAQTDQSIAWRLSVVYNELGIVEYKERKYYQAEDYFSLAISHNPTVAAFYLSRARSRYMQENLTEAQIDVLSALHLDCTNKEIFSMFARLYPGKTTAEVIKGNFGKLVVEALLGVIDDFKEQYGSREKDASGSTVTKNSPLPSIKSSSGYTEQLKQCMDDKEFYFSIIKGKKKVNELVESVIQSRQDLTFTGPKIKQPSKKTLQKTKEKK